jgi:hypothetical protein
MTGMEAAAPDDDAEAAKLAFILGCNEDETEQMMLFLDIMGWRCELISTLGQAPRAKVDLLTLSIGSIPEGWALDDVRSIAAVVAILIDHGPASSSELDPVHYLTRPFDLQAFERVVELAS